MLCLHFHLFQSNVLFPCNLFVPLTFQECVVHVPHICGFYSFPAVINFYLSLSPGTIRKVTSAFLNLLRLVLLHKEFLILGGVLCAFEEKVFCLSVG